MEINSGNCSVSLFKKIMAIAFVWLLVIWICPWEARAECPQLRSCFSGNVPVGCGCQNPETKVWGAVSCALGAERVTIQDGEGGYHFECKSTDTSALSCPSSQPCPVGTEHTGVCGNCVRVACENAAPGPGYAAVPAGSNKILLQGGYAYAECSYTRVCTTENATGCTPQCPEGFVYTQLSGKNPSCMPLNKCGKIVFYGLESQYSGDNLPRSKTVFCPEGSEYNLASCLCGAANTSGGTGGAATITCPDNRKPVYENGQGKCVSAADYDSRMKQIQNTMQLRGMTAAEYMNKVCNLSPTPADYQICKERAAEFGKAGGAATSSSSSSTSSSSSSSSSSTGGTQECKLLECASGYTPDYTTCKCKTPRSCENYSCDPGMKPVAKYDGNYQYCACVPATESCTHTQIMACEMKRGDLDPKTCVCVPPAESCTSTQITACEMKRGNLDPKTCVCVPPAESCTHTQVMACEMKRGNLDPKTCVCTQETTDAICTQRECPAGSKWNTKACGCDSVQTGNPSTTTGGTIPVAPAASSGATGNMSQCDMVRKQCSATGGIVKTMNGMCVCQNGMETTPSNSSGGSAQCTPKSCDPGYAWSKDACRCVPKEGGTSSGGDQCTPKSCDPGYAWSKDACRCAPKEGGTSSGGGQCTPKSCDPGYSWNQDACQCKYNGKDPTNGSSTSGAGSQCTGSVTCGRGTLIRDYREANACCPKLEKSYQPDGSYVYVQGGTGYCTASSKCCITGNGTDGTIMPINSACPVN